MTGIIILSRLSSKRLPKKHLLKINGKPVVEHFIQRILTNFSVNDFKIILSTTDKLDDRDFNYLKSKYPIKIYNGSSNNIPLRINGCLEKHGVEKAIILEGDDLLFSVVAIKDILMKLEEGFKFIKSDGLPLGMNVYGMTKQLFSESLASYQNKRKIETGWLRFTLEKPEIILYKYESDYQLRFTLDYKEDLMFFEELFNFFKERIYNVDYQELIKYVLKNEVHQINGFLETKYHTNFNMQINNEE
jgi:spore coat polysaccharide biosynthesis protein SpsF (cytidylyltransferase family)